MTNYRRRKAKPKEIKKRYSVNDNIGAEQVRLISEEGEMIGIMTIDEANAKAEEDGLDLIEINPKAEPPIVKLMSYSKFKYIQDKAEKSKVKVGAELKTLRVSVRISVHDLAVQARKADEFLKKNHKVKLQVQMKGREKAHPEVAKQTMETFLSLIEGTYTLETETKMMGDSCYAMLKPVGT